MSIPIFIRIVVLIFAENISLDKMTNSKYHRQVSPMDLELKIL
jgi:hypothetical protein